MDRSGATDRLHLIIVLRIVLHRPEEGDPDEEAAHDSTDISLLAATLIKPCLIIIKQSDVSKYSLNQTPSIHKDPLSQHLQPTSAGVTHLNLKAKK